MKKVYLETPEAVIKALKEGKEVYEENCPDYSFKLIENIIVAKCEDFFEVGSMVSIGNKPYILEGEPFEIEVGKWYETRDHQKARCYYLGKETAFFSIDNDSTPIGVYLNGRLYEDRESSFDIIGPWEGDN